MLGNKWQKSTRSNGSGACVEARRTGELVEVADTKDPATRSAPVVVSAEAWTTFLANVPVK